MNGMLLFPLRKSRKCDKKTERVGGCGACRANIWEITRGMDAETGKKWLIASKKIVFFLFFGSNNKPGCIREIGHEYTQKFIPGMMKKKSKER